MVSILFFCLGMSFNANMDVMEYHHDQYIFRGWEFMKHDWTAKYVDNNPELGRKKIIGIVIPAAFSDGWHLSKSLMISSFVASVIFYQPIGYWGYKNKILDFLVIGITGVMVFNLMYDVILR